MRNVTWDEVTRFFTDMCTWAFIRPVSSCSQSNLVIMPVTLKALELSLKQNWWHICGHCEGCLCVCCFVGEGSRL